MAISDLRSSRRLQASWLGAGPNILTASETLLDDYFKLKPREHVAIITDGSNPKVVNALRLVLKTSFSHPETQMHVVNLLNPKRASSSPIPEAAKALSKSHVIIAPTAASISYSPETQRALKRGARLLSMAAVSPDLFVQALSMDLRKMRQYVGRLKHVLKPRKTADGLVTGVKSVRIIDALGSDVTMEIAKRKLDVMDGTLHTQGVFENLPFGEVCLAPLEETATGKIVLKWWKGKKPGEGLARLRLEKGKIVWGNKAAKAIISYQRKHGGENGLKLGELGFGANPAFNYGHITGNPLPDEKIPGVHLGLGKNTGFGGSIDCNVHRDYILFKPTVYFDGKRVIHQGKLLGLRRA